jgi:diketogulonate reductase-like aldo/keto reductase
MKSVRPQVDIEIQADKIVVGDNVSDRSSTYLTTKYMPTHQPHSSSAVYDYLVKSVPKLNKGKSIEDGGYIDLMLIHAPFGGEKGRTENWAALARAQTEGWIKDIGVSNLYVHPS